MGMRKYIAIVLLYILVVSGFVGIAEIYTIAENISLETSANKAIVENNISAVKINEKLQNRIQKATNSILCSDVKTKISSISSNCDSAVSYCKNIYLEIDINSLSPVFLYYDCDPKKINKSIEDCGDTARRFVLRNLPPEKTIDQADTVCVGEKDCVAFFTVSVNGDIVFVNVRMDTGSVIYYEASSVFE